MHQEDTAIPNTYVPNNKASKYMKQKKLKRTKRIDKFTSTVGGFSPHLSIDKINKENHPNIRIQPCYQENEFEGA